MEYTLRDGTPIVISPIRPEDRAALKEGFAKLSERSVYLRFHTALPELSEKQLRYLTEVDHVDHVALVARLAGDPEGPGLGVARYVRLKDEPEVAEAAITVIDDWQGRGLGTVLLGALGVVAARHGVRVFRNYVLAENTAMLALFDDLGAERRRDDGGVYRIDFTVPTDPGDLPDTPAGRVIKAVARGELPALDPTLPPVWRG